MFRQPPRLYEAAAKSSYRPGFFKLTEIFESLHNQPAAQFQVLEDLQNRSKAAQSISPTSSSAPCHGCVPPLEQPQKLLSISGAWVHLFPYQPGAFIRVTSPSPDVQRSLISLSKKLSAFPAISPLFILPELRFTFLSWFWPGPGGYSIPPEDLKFKFRL